MKIYFFGANFNNIDQLYDSGFDGNLFTYSAADKDCFTLIAQSKPKLRKNFKYMVAIRPYVMSPQYLCMINKTITNSIGDILEINLITGWIKEEERPYNSFVGEINDTSSSVDRSNYLIEYLEVMDNLKKKIGLKSRYIPNIYVSATNHFVFEAASKLNYNVIIPYSYYIKNMFDIKNKSVSVSLSPIIRPTIEELSQVSITMEGQDVFTCTPEQLLEILQKIKNDKIDSVFLYSYGVDMPYVLDFVKKYKDQLSN
jgi:hypothetical protein